MDANKYDYLIGRTQQRGWLKIIGVVGKDTRRRVLVKCQCRCLRTTTIIENDFRSEHSKKCCQTCDGLKRRWYDPDFLDHWKERRDEFSLDQFLLYQVWLNGRSSMEMQKSATDMTLRCADIGSELLTFEPGRVARAWRKVKEDERFTEEIRCRLETK